MTTNVVEKMLEKAGFSGVGEKARERLAEAITEVLAEEITALDNMKRKVQEEMEQRDADFSAMAVMQKDLFDKHMETEKKILAEKKAGFEKQQREANSKLMLIYKLCGEVFGEQPSPESVTAEEPVQLVRNFYKCVCGYGWEDIHSCACDDRCPVCNTAVSPYDSNDLEKGE